MFEVGEHHLSLNEFGAAERSELHLDPIEFRLRAVGSCEVRIRQICTSEVGAPKPGTGEICMVKCVAKVLGALLGNFTLYDYRLVRKVASGFGFRGRSDLRGHQVRR
jgi:hypothetical protein